MPRTYGQQPSLQPPRTEPGPPPAPAGQITYEDLQCSFVLGRGIIVNRAPEHAKVSVAMLSAGHLGLDLNHPGHIKIAYQVEYAITGYDPADCTLTLRLVHDWRPGRKDDPNAEPTDDLQITPYLVVSHYRTDRGTWAWAWRCWGDGTCDGHLALDLSNRAYAERKARTHLAENHPTDATVETAATDAGDNFCGTEPPQRADDPDSPWGDCWCTLPRGHDGDHVCEPCRDRHGAPGWPNPNIREGGA